MDHLQEATITTTTGVMGRGGWGTRVSGKKEEKKEKKEEKKEKKEEKKFLRTGTQEGTWANQR